MSAYYGQEHFPDSDDRDIFSSSSSQEWDGAPEMSESVYSYSKSGGPKKTKRKKKKRLLPFVSICAVVLVGLFLLLQARPIQQSDSKETNPDLEKIVTSGSSKASYFLVCGMDKSGDLTDIMMIVCFDMKAKTVSILQIPRDTYVGRDIPTAKFNAVYGSPREGEAKIKALIRRINFELAIPIDHYITITIDGFRNLVDAVGGVSVKLDNEITVENHAQGGTVNLGPGTVVLDKDLAEGFVRHRRGYAMGDLDRVRAQRRFFAGFAKKMLDMSVPQMSKAATTCYNEIKTDLSIGEMLSFVKKASGLKMQDISVYGLPGQAVNNYTPEGFSTSLDYYSVHRQEFLDLFNTHMNPYGKPITDDMIDIREIFSTYYESMFANDSTTFDSYVD